MNDVHEGAWDLVSAKHVRGYEARWSPVLVLSHDCELEKEFNERVVELVSAGMSEEAAIEEACVDPTLDPFAMVAPLLREESESPT